MKATLKHLSAAALCFLVMASSSVIAGPQGNSQGKKHKGGPVHAAPAVQHGGTHVEFHFSTGNVRVMRDYYAPRYRQLPPGLQKKYARTGQLPPGWAKRMEPLPVAIERDLPRLPDGYRRGVIDGHAVIYSSRAGTIIDVAVLF